MDKGHLYRNTTLVMISIGGNDSRFAETIQKCLMSVGNVNRKDETFDKLDDSVGGRDKQFVGQPLETAIPGLMNQVVRPDITQVLKEIHDRAQNAKIVLMGYLPLISDRDRP
ncbi:hypothetical protein [Streptomyces alanosinicus]|uniref:SGNH hydrolase-type esterase domain-containing protein n=1 Tax=Streptomyces alanosinicus TaxID=68171 RepID=A0A918YSJ3_9ACTN|nr:hypothetical protein [Streptomyces alanosinicus]GHE13705.1 hypothetical protein GCM10010339_81540 [Streptomyces alanosinicus]